MSEAQIQQQEIQEEFDDQKVKEQSQEEKQEEISQVQQDLNVYQSEEIKDSIPEPIEKSIKESIKGDQQKDILNQQQEGSQVIVQAQKDQQPDEGLHQIESTKQQQSNSKESHSFQKTYFGLKFQLDSLETFIGRKADLQIENQALIFSLSDQRKQECLKILKEWVKERTDVFDFSREVLEELISAVDIRSKLSVEFLQTCYKFFTEKCVHEAQYAKFLLTKPQPSFKLNHMATSVYKNIGNAIAQLDQRNLKQQSSVANFASRIESDILNAPIFNEFNILDEKSDNLIKSLSIQKKQLQNLLFAASSKLNQIIPLFPQFNQKQQPPAQNVFVIQSTYQQRNRKPIFEVKQKSMSSYVIKGLSNFGSIFLGPLPATQNSMDLSNQNQTDSSQTEQNQKEDSISTETNASEEDPQFQQQNSTADVKIQSQKQSHSLQKSHLDLFVLIWALIRNQEQANSAVNLSVERFLSYWDHTIQVEKKRCKWISESIQLYNKMYQEVYKQEDPLQIISPSDQDIEDAYSLESVLAQEIYNSLKSKHLEVNRGNLKDVIYVHPVPCQAARLLIIKEFKVIHLINSQQELPAQLILTTDKYLGCWDILDQQTIENIEKPLLHNAISATQINKLSNVMVEIIPSKHLLFVNVGNEKQKLFVKFQNSDDLEEFLTVIDSLKN